MKTVLRIGAAALAITLAACAGIGLSQSVAAGLIITSGHQHRKQISVSRGT